MSARDHWHEIVVIATVLHLLVSVGYVISEDWRPPPDESPPPPDAAVHPDSKALGQPIDDRVVGESSTSPILPPTHAIGPS